MGHRHQFKCRPTPDSFYDTNDSCAVANPLRVEQLTWTLPASAPR
jgi:hypothetical protein